MRRQADLNRLIEAFAKNLRTRRQELGLTQEQLADICGFSTNFIGRMEIGRNTPSFGGLAKLAKALRIPASELLSTDYEAGVFNIETTVSALMDPLTDSEKGYALSQLQGLVHFFVSSRKTNEEN